MAFQLVPAALIVGEISTAQIAPDAITSAKISAGAVDTAALAAGAVTTAQINAAAGILGSQIANATIEGNNIQAGTITAALLAAGIVVAGIINGTEITGAQFVADGTSGQILVYNGTPAFGNLIVSISGAAGTDSSGNSYDEGVAVYNSSTGQSIVLLSGQVQLNVPSQTNPGLLYGEAPGTTILQSPEMSALDLPAVLALISSVSSGFGVPVAELPAVLINRAVPSGYTNGPGLGSSGGKNLEFASGNDANAYQTGRLTLVTAGTQLINSVTPAVITGLSVPVAATSYKYRALVLFEGNQAAGSPRFEVSSPAASAILTACKFYTVGTSDFTTNSVLTGFVTGASGTFPIPTVMAASAFYVAEFEGTATFTAAGTLALEAFCTVAADTFTIQPGSWLELYPCS
jgi:hypothetical protein